MIDEINRLIKIRYINIFQYSIHNISFLHFYDLKSKILSIYVIAVMYVDHLIVDTD